MTSFPRFLVLHEHGGARRGRLETYHGVFETPGFFFCATKGTLKGLSTRILNSHGVPALLSNTYHLMIQPGAELIEEFGGLHKFMAWDKPLFTDSGGYQIFSLHHGSVSDEIKGRKRSFPSSDHGTSPGVKVKKTGAHFRSHIDGKKWILTPELSVDVQCRLGSDFMCVLDECTPLHMTYEETKKSMILSHHWEDRSLKAFEEKRKPWQGLYGIVQGGIYPDLRIESKEFVLSRPFFGHAIGGSLGANKEQMYSVVADIMADRKLQSKPIHLLGIGGLKDIFFGIQQGIDTFDCVHPTRLGRHGGALIQPHYWHNAQEPYHGREHINLWRSCFSRDQKPIDETCPCETCQQYSRGYLHYLLKGKELLALTALTLHNVVFMTRFMASIRQGIEDNNLLNVKNQWLPREES